MYEQNWIWILAGCLCACRFRVPLLCCWSKANHTAITPAIPNKCHWTGLRPECIGIDPKVSECLEIKTIWLLPASFQRDFIASERRNSYSAIGTMRYILSMICTMHVYYEFAQFFSPLNRLTRRQKRKGKKSNRVVGKERGRLLGFTKERKNNFLDLDLA